MTAAKKARAAAGMTMSALEVRLLGRFEIRNDGTTIRLPGRKERALLTFLAMSAGQSHSRSELASLLWGASGERQARSLNPSRIPLLIAFR